MTMLNEKQILEEVEKTLHSYDNDIILEENPFLLTRIRAARENRLQNRKKGFALKISLNQAMVIVILLINLITFVYYYERDTEQIQQESLISALKADCQIDQTQNIF